MEQFIPYSFICDLFNIILETYLQVGYCIFHRHEITWFPAKKNTTVIFCSESGGPQLFFSASFRTAQELFVIFSFQNIPSTSLFFYFVFLRKILVMGRGREEGRDIIFYEI